MNFVSKYLKASRFSFHCWDTAIVASTLFDNSKIYVQIHLEFIAVLNALFHSTTNTGKSIY